MRKILFVLFAGIIFWGCKKDKDGTVTVVPISPTELTASVISTTQVNLSWTDKSTNETGFKIQRKTGSGNFADVGTVGKDVTNFSDKGLTPATTYTYRVYAYNSTGASLSYTNEVTVTTFGAAVLITTAISNISNTTAKSGGTISSDGGSPITARGIVWGTSTNPTVVLTTKTSDGTGAGTFTSNLIGLTANTTYYVRAYATNSLGTYYGNELSFKTLNADITTGLIAYFPFNGNANDESGNGNNGTVNGATLTNDRFGNSNNAYSFNGINNYISIRNIINSPAFTISLWYYTTASLINGQQMMYYQGTNEIQVSRGPSNVGCGVKLSNDTYYSTNSNSSSTSIKINNWQHLVATYTAGGKIYLFQNGTLVDSSITTPNLGFWTGNAPKSSIGAYDQRALFFNGFLDDIRIYNRVLKQEEISYLANN